MLEVMTAWIKTPPRHDPERLAGTAKA